MSGDQRAARRRHAVVVTFALLALLSAASACAGSGARRKDTVPIDSAGATTPRSVVPRPSPPPACPPPTTPPHGVTTTAPAATGAWPPPGYDRSALVRADVLSWSDGAVHLRWQAGQGVEPCEADLGADTAWVLDASGYREIHGPEIGAFVAQRRRDLGTTAAGVPFLVEVSDDGRTAVQLGEVPPG